MGPTDVVRGLLEQEDVSEVDSNVRARFACCLQVGRQSLPYVLATRANLIIGRFMQLFCMTMALSPVHVGLRTPS